MLAGDDVRDEDNLCFFFCLLTQAVGFRQLYSCCGPAALLLVP